MSDFKEQVKFARLMPRLIDKAFELGFLVSIGDGFRDKRAFPEGSDLPGVDPYGAKNSDHKRRLAIDLNLFWGTTLGSSK